VPVLFGDPFLLRVGPQETVGQIRARIQQKLGVASADFEAWRVAFVSSRAAPHYLAGRLWFQATGLGWKEQRDRGGERGEGVCNTRLVSGCFSNNPYDHDQGASEVVVPCL
jgi:hypothetical protein